MQEFNVKVQTATGNSESWEEIVVAEGTPLQELA